MPEDGSRLSNVAALADESRRVELVIPVERFERIAAQLASREGVVTGSVELGRERRQIVAEVTLATELQFFCQRCLQQMSMPVASQSRVALLESETGEAPPEMETALAPEGRLRLADLVEEELLLALPAAPRHPEGQCPSGEREVKQEEFAEPTQRPFASLGAMLKPVRPKK
jgi:uncharacterized protein